MKPIRLESLVRRALAVALFLTAPVSSGACGSSVSCNGNLESGLDVTVVNGVGSNQQCAPVTAVDGSYSEHLSCYATAMSCECYGAMGRAGTYQITAVRSDGATAATTVTVEKGECGVIQEKVALELP